jgi:hypothetical protein
MTRSDLASARGNTEQVAYMVASIVLLILLTGLWAYLWVH